MIKGGTGDDQISLSSSSKNNLIQYDEGDGNDIIWGLSANSTLNISAESYNSVASGDDIIVKVGDGSITLKDSRNKPPHIVLGESGSSGGGSGGSGGGSGSGGGGGSGSGGGSAGGSGGGSGNSSGGSSGNGGSNGTGGTNSGRGNSDDRRNDNTTAANQLWGNVYNEENAIFGGGDADTFTGTEEADTFVSGKNQGSDTFRNISVKDTIYLNDATLSDLVNVKDVNGFIYLGFNSTRATR